jgi:hypothetical protein
MLQISVLSPDQVDFNEILMLQKEAFKEIMARNAMESVQTAELYRWKYNPPAGAAKIAVVRDGNKLVAMNSMFPLILKNGEEKIRIWQSCDTATAPEARGKGLFIQCLKALRNELQRDEIFFGFPNHNSAPGFVKFGWKDRGTLLTSVRFIPAWVGSSQSSIKQVLRFDSSQDEFAERWSKLGGPAIYRDAAYMNWRYFQHPDVRYFCFRSVGRDGVQLGHLVLREIFVKNRRALIIMENLALDSKTEAAQRKFAIVKASEMGIRYVLMMNNRISALSALSSMYIPIPERFLPKRQVLMGAGNSDRASQAFDMDWRVEIGDWDGF